MVSWSTGGHLHCRREPTDGCPLRLRSSRLQAQGGQPCQVAEHGSLGGFVKQGSPEFCGEQLGGDDLASLHKGSTPWLSALKMCTIHA